LLNSEASIGVDGERAPYTYKTGGYFVLIGLEEGKHEILIKSYKFQTERVSVNVDYSRQFREDEDVIYVMMNPSKMHPAALNSPVISGAFSPKKEYAFYIAANGAGLKIAEDSAKAGNQTLRLFSESSVVLPSLFRIDDKSEDTSEFVMLKSAEGDLYSLGGKLEFDHKRSAQLVPMVKYTSGENGDFFAVIPSGYAPDPETGKIELSILVDTGKKRVYTAVSVNPKGITDVGTISLRRGK
jgi:hypothetical protein